MYCLEKFARLLFEKSVVSSVNQMRKQDQGATNIPPVAENITSVVMGTTAED